MNGDSKSKIKNSPFKIYQSTETCRDGDILDDMLGHHRSAQVNNQLNGLNHFESLSKDSLNDSKTRKIG